MNTFFEWLIKMDDTFERIVPLWDIIKVVIVFGILNALFRFL